MRKFVSFLGLIGAAWLMFQPLSSAADLADPRLRYPSPNIAQLHVKSRILTPVVPLNYMRRQIYARLGKGRPEGIAGWERFPTKDGLIKACILPGADGAERVSIVTWFPKQKLSWRDVLASPEAMRTVPLLKRNDDGRKTLQIRVDNPESILSLQITVITGEEWVEQITWTLVGV